MASKNLYAVVLADDDGDQHHFDVAAMSVETAERLAKDNVRYGASTQTVSVTKIGTVVVDND